MRPIFDLQQNLTTLNSDRFITQQSISQSQTHSQHSHQQCQTSDNERSDMISDNSKYSKNPNFPGLCPIPHWGSLQPRTPQLVEAGLAAPPQAPYPRSQPLLFRSQGLHVAHCSVKLATRPISSGLRGYSKTAFVRTCETTPAVVYYNQQTDNRN